MFEANWGCYFTRNIRINLKFPTNSICLTFSVAYHLPLLSSFSNFINQFISLKVYIYFSQPDGQISGLGCKVNFIAGKLDIQVETATENISDINIII